MASPFSTIANKGKNQKLEKCIYIEARIRQYSPDDALTEMRKQMKDRSE